MNAKCFLLILIGLSAGCTVPMSGSTGAKLTFAPQVNDLQWWDRQAVMSGWHDQSLIDHFGMNVSLYLISDERREYEQQERRTRWLGEMLGVEVEAMPVDWLNQSPPQ